jgi:hypothetical protein
MVVIARFMEKKSGLIAVMARQPMQVQEAIHKELMLSSVPESPKKGPVAETEPQIQADDAICIDKKQLI